MLPPAAADFTGRRTELDEITAVISASGAGRLVSIHGRCGRPGVGTTALAIRLGHLLADRFCDRQVLVDLNAVTAGPRPADCAEALAALLAADGADARWLPADLAGRAAMWRARMAGRQALIILDGVTQAAQVAPLLPAPAGCLIVTTSRRRMDGLAAARIEVPLDVLPTGDARALFRRLAGRAAGAPAKATELVGLCGRLPLAICLLARLLARQPAVSTDDLLRAMKAGLAAGRPDDQPLAIALTVSYRYLTASQQLTFRRLGPHRGEVDAHAAAALTGLPLDRAAAHLGALSGRGLLAETAPLRYRMPGVIGDYARALADGDGAHEQERAMERLLDYYRQTAEAVSQHYPGCTGHGQAGPAARPGMPMAPALLPDRAARDQAHAWMAAELANLLAGIERAAGRGELARVVSLTAAIAAHLRARGSWTQAVALHTAAAAAAGRIGDRLGEASALRELAAVRMLTGDYPGAAAALDRALRLYREPEDSRDEACALCLLGLVRRLTGDYPGALAALDRALRLHRDLGDRSGEAQTMDGLGIVRYAAQDYQGAAAAANRALRLCRELKDRFGEAHVLVTLGAVRYVTGDHEGAVAALELALAIHDDLGTALGAANVLLVLEGVLFLTGDRRGAAAAQQRALAIHRDLGNRLGEAEALNHTAALHLADQNPMRARANYRHALGVARAIPSQREEARALEGIGRCARQMHHAGRAEPASASPSG